MKKTLKVVGGVIFALVMMKACQYDYACSVVESIPQNCFDRILQDHPNMCGSTMELAQFWEACGDSIKNDVRITEDAQNHWEEYK